MQNNVKGLLTLKTSQETLPLNEANEKCVQKNLIKKQQKNTEMEKENIDRNFEGQKEVRVHPEKFNGPGQKPKTANKAFGGILDFVLFFENRNPEIKEFTEQFKSIEKMDLRQSITELNKVIVPQIDRCLNQMYHKNKASVAKSKIKKHENKYAGLFRSSFKAWEEFYKQIFRAYTISGFLYKKMNKYLRNENWMELDALLPYVYCLFKAFLWGPTGLTRQESFETLRRKLKGNKLILFRGADFDDESLEFYDPTKIKNFSWNGVISTSLEESVTKKFQGNRSKRPILITIEIDFENLQAENLNALYLAGFSEYPKEEEVALPPGSIFELLEINKENPEVVMRLRLVTNVEALAHKGQFMHGMLQAIMRSENELKIVCLEEKELSRAMNHCQGNKLIKNLEFCFCIFNNEAIRVFKEAIPTIENLVSLTLNILKLEEDCRLDEILKCLEKTRIKKLDIFATLDERRHIEAMVESMKYLGSLEYLKLGLEEDSQMDATLFQDLIGSGCQFLSSKCILDVNLGTRYNLVTKGSNLNDFERLDIMKAMNKNWPPWWGRPPNSISKTKFLSENFYVKQHLKATQGIEEKSLNDCETQITEILDSEGMKDENIEIIESSRGLRKCCLVEGTLQIEFLTSLHLRFKEDEISDEEMIIFCSKIQHLQSLKILNLIFDKCGGISDKEVAILSCQGIQKLSSITSLSLSFKNCEKITDEGLKTFGVEGIKHLPLLTFLHLNFNWCGFITDEGLKTLVSEGIKDLPLLTSLHLNFEYCKDITDEGLKTLVSEGIKDLPLLTSLHLNFEYCKSITDEGLKTLGSEGIKHLPLLTSLHMNFTWCESITNEGLKTLVSEGIKHLPLLTSLHLNFEYCKSITDEGLKTLGSEGIKHLPLLTSLHMNFTWCESITNEGLKMLGSEGIKHLPLLTSLYLNFTCCESITDEGLKTLGSEGIKHLPLLISLHLNFKCCKSITDEGLKTLGSEGIKHLPLLTSLHLNFESCKSITDEGLKTLVSEGIKHLPLLISLHLNFTCCKSITDEGLKTLGSEGIKHLPLLTSLHLNFMCCIYIRDEGLKALGSEGIKHLPLLTSLHLNFNWCGFITDEGLKTLGSEGIKHLPLLTSLHLNFTWCESITDEGLETLGSEGIKHLPLLTSLHMNFTCFKSIKDEGLKNLYSQGIKQLSLPTSLSKNDETIESPRSTTWSKIDSLPIHQYQDLQISKNSVNFTRSSFQNLSDSNQNAAFAVFHVKPGFYLKEYPFECEPNIPKLLQNHSPFHDKDFDDICSSKETQKNYQATFHLNFTSEPIDDDGISNLEDAAAPSWQDMKILNLIFNPCPRSAPQRLKSYWNILQYFKSIVELNIIFNAVGFPLDEGLSSLFGHGRFENFKSLKSVNLVFPEAIISERAKRNLLKASSSFALNLLTSKKFEIKVVDLKMSKQKVQSFISRKTCQILKTKSQEIQMILQSSPEKSNMFLSKNEMDPIQNKQIVACKQRNWESELTLNENTNKRHFGCQEKITNSQEKFKPFHSTESVFLEDQSFPIHELNFQELLNLKSLIVLDLNFFERNNITNEILQILSFIMSDLKSLRALNLSLYGCKLVSDEGLSNLSSQGLKPLRKLTELSLNFGLCSRITDRGLDYLSCEGIKHLELLTKLHLNFEWCQLITDKGFESLSNKVIEPLKLLTDLHLNFQNCPDILDFESKRLFNGLQNLKLLTFLSLDFGYCKIHDQDIQSLSSNGIQHLESLIDLRLRFNNYAITDWGLEQLADGLQNLKSLTTLSLNFDRCYSISDQGIKYLSCQGLQSLKSLTSLYLSFDGDASSILTNQGLKSLCHEGIHHLTSLVSLYLNFYIHEGISYGGLESLCCEGIQHLDHLKNLELISSGKNQITDRGIKNLAFKAMSKLISLENLQLPLMQITTSSSSIVEAFRNILIYFGLQQDSNT